jgi:uncharacterized protein (TIGR02231 family)
MEADMAAAPPRAAKARPAPMAQAQRKRSTLAVVYMPPKPVTVPSRTQETLIPLQTKALSGDFYHYAIPKMDPRTFLVCQLETDTELLPGSMGVYFDGRFQGRTQLAEQPPGGEFRLNLGIDRDVKIQRRKMIDKVKETYFGKIDRNSVVRQLRYQIDITNSKTEPITLHLRDHLPISRTDRIKIKDITLTPEPVTKADQDLEGVTLWKFTLKPGETKKTILEFVVIYPKEITPPAF